MFGFGEVTFEMAVESTWYAKQAVEYMSSEFRDEVQAGDINTSVIRIQVLS